MIRLGLITPNNETFSNPMIVTFFEELQKKGIEVYLFGPEQKIGIPNYLSNIHYYQLNGYFKRFPVRPRYIVKIAKSYLQLIKIVRQQHIRLLIGIDPQGFITAARIGKLLKIRVCYFSFEIFFNDECAAQSEFRKIKKLEIYYSSFCDHALVQDEVRLNLLIKENKFKEDCRFFLIPVSPKEVKLPAKPDLHAKLGIPADKKLVIYSGSITKWAGMDKLIKLIESDWDTRFWLVIHGKHEIKNDNMFYSKIKALQEANYNISLDNNQYITYEEYCQYLSGFEMALALYFPEFGKNVYLGKNLKNMGLSSGKFSTYMMVGLPTIVTQSETFVELHNRYDFGAVIVDTSELKSTMAKIADSQRIKSIAAKKLYDAYLEPTNKINQMIDTWVEYYSKEDRVI